MYLPTTNGIKMKNKLIAISFLFFLIFLFFFSTTSVFATCASPGDDYHSFRPSPADPCNEEYEDQSLLCGNTMQIIKRITKTPANGSCNSTGGNDYTCSFVDSGHIEVSVDTSSSKLPIMGNTELVANNEQFSDQIDDTTKVNDFVSWYLNGAVNYAENPHPIEDLGDVLEEWWTGYYKNAINYSGPLRKLLPQEVQWNYKEAQIEKSLDKNADDAVYDQVVGCTYGLNTPIKQIEDAINSFLNIFGVANIQIPLASIGNFIGPCKTNTTIGGILLSRFKEEHRLSEWVNHLPPKIEKYNDPENPRAWRVAYLRWRGKSCLVLPGWKIVPGFLRNQGICFENYLKDNYWADLYSNIPMSSMEDRLGSLSINKPSDKSGDEIEVEIKNFKQISSATLNFPHMQETAELSAKLQTTYKPQEGTNNSTGYTEKVDIDNNCTILQVRSGDTSGDSLYGTTALAEFDYTASFTCTFSYSDKNPSCEKTMTLTSTIDTNTPLADEVWNNLVAGNSSVVRRMFPQLGIKDIGSLIDFPTSTTAQYSATGADVKPEAAEIYFPHIGSIDEYFLKGIQTLLRPQGYGEHITFSDTFSTGTDGEINCDQNILNIEVPGLIKSEAERITEMWYGVGVGKPYFKECNNDVIKRSQSAGVNPIFALAIWIHESDASNYEAKTPVEDFGIHGSSSAPPNDFSAQLNAFLNLPDFYSSKCGSKNLDTFISMFWFGHCSPQNQEERNKLNLYIDELNFIYSVIAPGINLPNYPK